MKKTTLLIFAFLVNSLAFHTLAAPTVFLTYDDGPDPKYTPALLAVLDKHKVKATFFVTGEKAKAHPEIVKHTFELGHTIANHSYAHKSASDMTLAQIKTSYNQTDAIIRSITGQTEILFRAPFLNISKDSRQFLCSTQRNSVDVDMVGKDWETQDPEQIVKNLLEHKPMQSKSPDQKLVVLLHDSGQGPNGTRQGTVDATDKLITMMKQAGYTFADQPPRHKWQLTPQDCNTINRYK